MVSFSTLQTIFKGTSISKPETKAMLTKRRRTTGRLQKGHFLKRRNDLMREAFEEYSSGSGTKDERGNKPGRQLGVPSVLVKSRNRKELKRKEQTAWKRCE